MFIRKVFRKINRLLDKPFFQTKDVTIGKNVYFGRNVVFNSEKVVIGDGAILMDNIKVNSTEFELGDYGTIYQNCFFPGPGRLKIGHNFWLGNNSIIDSQGNTIIGNNVGIGAYSQLWGHLAYGDIMFGCRFNSVKQLVIGNDVWLVGHNLVSPVKIGDRSMALLGSLITKNMAHDRTYAGHPAIDITDKVGRQFNTTDYDERLRFLSINLDKFCETKGINRNKYFNIVDTHEHPIEKNKTNFILSDRAYTKRGTKIEMEAIRFLLPRAKFTPFN